MHCRVPNLLSHKEISMLRYLAGAAVAFLLFAGSLLIWQSRAEEAPSLPAAPKPRAASGFLTPRGDLNAPEADPKTREEKRFSRADKDKDGRIESEEVLGSRRKAFAKLDLNGNGALSFEEWAAKTIDKFKGADKDRSGWLTPAEYALTAPPPPKHPTRCSCSG
jgi:hypothetical protein